MADIVPGVITHFSLANGRLALNYRRIDENTGSVHRFRVYRNLTQCDANMTSYDFKEELSNVLVDDLLLGFHEGIKSDSEDFEVKGSFTITSLNLNKAGDQLMYSRNPDFYQYRVLRRTHTSDSEHLWLEDQSQHGPPIDRTKDRIFLPIGLSYTHDDQILLTVLKGGPQHADVRLFVEFHNYTAAGNDSNLHWAFKKKIYDKSLPIHQAPNIFNTEVIHVKHNQLSESVLHFHRAIQLFGQYFIALDWNQPESKYQVFETYKDLFKETS